MVFYEMGSIIEKLHGNSYSTTIVSNVTDVDIREITSGISDLS